MPSSVPGAGAGAGAGAGGWGAGGAGCDSAAGAGPQGGRGRGPAARRSRRLLGVLLSGTAGTAGRGRCGAGQGPDGGADGRGPVPYGVGGVGRRIRARGRLSASCCCGVGGGGQYRGGGGSVHARPNLTRRRPVTPRHPREARRSTPRGNSVVRSRHGCIRLQRAPVVPESSDGSASCAGASGTGSAGEGELCRLAIPSIACPRPRSSCRRRPWDRTVPRPCGRCGCRAAAGRRLRRGGYPASMTT